MMYPLPLASSSEKVHENFESNQFSVTRQVRYSLTNPGEEIDMVIFINGLPFATMELKIIGQDKMPKFMVKTNINSKRYYTTLVAIWAMYCPFCGRYG